MAPDEDGGRLSCMDIVRTMGPGIMVCLADTDGPCLITAADSGAKFKYHLLLTQLLLIPVLFMAQELTVRLGLYTHRGMTELVRELYGEWVAIILCFLIAIICVGAIISEIVVISQVGTICGIPLVVSCLLTAFILGLIVVTGGYKTVEKVGVALGAFQLVFLPMMFLTKPDLSELWNGLWDYSEVLNKTDAPAFMHLLAANIGAVIMPWMLLYQQSAICDKRNLRACKSHLKLARIDTGVGSVLTQLVMSAMVISIAAASSRKALLSKGGGIEKVEDIITLLAPYCGGELAAKIILCSGMVGASLTAALVVSLCAAWCMAEAVGAPRSLEMPIRSAPTFYVGYFAVLVAGIVTAMLLGEKAAVDFNIGVQVLNAFTMPVIIGILFWLSSASHVLPDDLRLKGFYKWTVCAVFVVVSIFSFVAVGLDLFYK